MSDKIRINNLRFHAYHGHLPVERKTGNTFVVDLVIHCDLDKSGRSDNLNDTVDYVTVMKLVEDEMLIPTDLIENVAHRIALSIKNNLKLVEQIEVTVKKQKPPLRFDLDAVEVTIVR
ncbi:MAG: dihydroneopterin aldolase [Salibacteraceae bacterium]